MKECNVIAIDLAKLIFQVCIMTNEREITFNKAMKRAQLIQWLVKQQPSLVVMESCGGANYWARFAQSHGHQVMIIPPRQVKPFRTGQKTDANDAIAIAIASQAPNIKSARCLTIDQQGLQAVERMRGMLDKQKLQLSNQIRGLLLEFGIVINQGASAFKKRIPEILEDAENDLSAAMRESLDEMNQFHTQLEERYKVLDTRLVQLTKQDDACQRLMALEGVGPISAVGLKLQLGHGEHFNKGREASACIGVTPKQHSSGGKVKLGSVGKVSCDRNLRSNLFLGARAVASKLKTREAKTHKEQWLKALIERRGVNCAAMALANKTVRTAYAILKNDTVYKAAPLVA